MSTGPTPHPRYAELAALAIGGGHLVVPWKGRACRAVPPPYAIQGELLSGTYAAIRGGRWNRCGLQAVYASLDAQTVLAEVGQLDLGAGFTGVVKFQRSIVWFEAALAKTIDLRDPAVLDISSSMPMSS